MDKKYNTVLGLMIFFFLIVVGVSLAWGLGYIGVKSDNVLTTNDNSETVNNNETHKTENDVSNTIQKEQEESTNNTTTDSISPTNASSSDSSNQFVLDVTKLDSSKCLNAKGITYKYSTVKYNHGVYVDIKDNKLFFGVNNDELGESNIKIEKYKDYEITGINAEDVSEVYISGWGQAVDFPAVYFLMKDRSIIWLNSEDAITNKDFAVEGKIPNVENVVRIVNASCYDGVGGGYTIVGLKSDGTFYDLCLETVNKQ